MEKRILLISQHLNRAGTEAFMMSVFRGIDHSRFQVDFLIYNKLETDYSREVEAAGNKVWRVTSRRESPLKWYKELNRFFKEHAGEYAAIHYCGNGLTTIAPLVFAYCYGVPIRIVHSHNSSSSGFHNRLLHILQRGIAKRLTTHHFACSSEAAKWFFGRSPSVIIRNGIDTRLFDYNPQSRDETRQQLNISPSATVMIHVGRFTPEKNHTFLLDVFAAFLEQRQDALLVLVGNGPLMEQTVCKSKELGISNRVVFLGERKDVPCLLQAADCFLMPSTFEGQPFVLIEAQCSGLPCIVSDVVNDDICLTANVTRLSLKTSAKEWSARIATICDSYVRRSCREEIERQGYSIRETVNYLEKVYDGAI